MASGFLPCKANPLDILLATLGARLAYLSQTDDEQFVKLTKDKTLVLQFLSDDGVARFFEFDDTKFIQSLGIHATPTLTITFKDSFDGAKQLVKSDMAVLMRAIQDGDIRLTGETKLIVWFSNLIKRAVQLPKPLKEVFNTAKPYLNQATTWLKKLKK